MKTKTTLEQCFVEKAIELNQEEYASSLCNLFRYERLEEQLNDLTELHQNEMTNLKQELASMEEKVAYQSYERARDIQVRTSSISTRNHLSYCLKFTI